MSDRSYNLAIETSGRGGSISLGLGDEILASADLGRQRRHNVALVPGIDRLCRERDVSPREISEVYVSLGPGSFTGLRVGITTAKTIAFATGARLVGVPTMDLLPFNAPEDADRVAVGLNYKRETLYSGVFEREGDGWRAVVEPGLRTLDDLLDAAGHAATLIAEKLPPDAALPAGVVALPPERAAARSEVLWRLGRERASRGDFVKPATLLPLYVREPEAVTLWNERHGSSSDAPETRPAASETRRTVN